MPVEEEHLEDALLKKLNPSQVAFISGLCVDRSGVEALLNEEFRKYPYRTGDQILCSFMQSHGPGDVG